MKKADLYGIIGATIACLIVLLLLLFIYMPGIQTPEDEGIEITFGDFDAGGGGNRSGIEDDGQINLPIPTTPTASASPIPTPPVPQTQPVESRPPAQSTSNENIMTQEDPSVAIAIQQEKDRKKREEAEKKRIEEERQLAEKRKREEQLRQQQIIANANALGSAFGSSATQGTSSGASGSGTGTGTGSGTGSGSGIGSGTESGVQGNPAGTRMGGPSLSLGNRKFRNGNYTKPNYTRNVEGVVTVSIRVNEKGDVISAGMTSPTTISDEATIMSAVDAARKTKFTEGDAVVTGTITYHFVLN